MWIGLLGLGSHGKAHQPAVITSELQPGRGEVLWSLLGEGVQDMSVWEVPHSGEVAFWTRQQVLTVLAEMNTEGRLYCQNR